MPAATPAPASPLPAWWSRRPPAAGASVMATGILSVALHQTGHAILSRIALALACVAWLALACDFLARLLWHRSAWVRAAVTPVSLCAVAATAVLGTRFAAAGRQSLAEALLALAFALWPGLLYVVVRHWRHGMPGSVFLGCVATQGLAVLAATLAATAEVAWLAHAALVLFWLGLLLYAVAWTRFDRREVVRGPGDHWVAGGALAISALAGARLLAADGPVPDLWNDDDFTALRTVTYALVALDMAWFVVLLVAEIARPRPRYDVRRWSTVFPMGMSAAAMLSVSATLDVPWLEVPGEVLLWIAVAVWVAVAAGAVRHHLADGPPAGVTSRARR
ncbi:tellurite resistance/C4-dicarboxylate transporter family protein [Streptomyces sp. NPDC101117]|uniref:tellurite resistance/C4-dicarboxylate transporter family protein n=1 Tax=Streptomyces sp. NPDC101117 TaxID=3366108 RepID=UPI003823807A